MIQNRTAIDRSSIFTPLPWQIAPWRDQSLVMLLAGSAGGGKSSIAAEKVHGYCLRYPGAVGICLRKAREYASKSVVYALKRAIGDDPSVVYHKSDMMFHYANGSRIFIAGMKDDAQRQALRSINGNGSADIIWAEEANALTEDDHNELLARLRGNAASWRQIIYSTNPDTPSHWIKRRLMDGREATVFLSQASDNTHNPHEYLSTLKKLTGVMRMRMAEGKWIQAEGAVYDEFSDQIHVIDSFPIPDDWRRLRSIDFGYVHPFVCQWWAMDGDGRLYMYREIYMTKRTVHVHAQQIKEYEDNGIIENTITDHDAEDRATLEENGIYSTAAIKEISPGIQAVKQRLQLAEDGRPHLFLMRGALVEVDDSLESARRPISTQQEFASYVWPKTNDGKLSKDVPVKDFDHGMDTMRYLVMHVDRNSGPLFLW